MTRHWFKDSFGWGFILWLAGYVLGLAFFFVLPSSLIGWCIMPIGVALSLWVLLKRVRSDSLGHFALIAAVWTAIAVVFDYAFIFLAFNPPDGYYKLDVYLYYLLTFTFPLAVGWWKTSRPMRGVPV